MTERWRDELTQAGRRTASLLERAIESDGTTALTLSDAEHEALRIIFEFNLLLTTKSRDSAGRNKAAAAQFNAVNAYCLATKTSYVDPDAVEESKVHAWRAYAALEKVIGTPTTARTIPLPEAHRFYSNLGKLAEHPETKPRPYTRRK